MLIRAVTQLAGAAPAADVEVEALLAPTNAEHAAAHRIQSLVRNILYLARKVLQDVSIAQTDEEAETISMNEDVANAAAEAAVTKEKGEDELHDKADDDG